MRYLDEIKYIQECLEYLLSGLGDMMSCEEYLSYKLYVSMRLNIFRRI